MPDLIGHLFVLAPSCPAPTFVMPDLIGHLLNVQKTGHWANPPNRFFDVY